MAIYICTSEDEQTKNNCSNECDLCGLGHEQAPAGQFEVLFSNPIDPMFSRFFDHGHQFQTGDQIAYEGDIWAINEISVAHEDDPHLLDIELLIVSEEESLKIREPWHNI